MFELNTEYNCFENIATDTFIPNIFYITVKFVIDILNMPILLNGGSIKQIKLFSLQIKGNSSLPGRYLMFSGIITAGSSDHALVILPFPNVHAGGATVNDSNSRLVRHEICKLFQADTESMSWDEDPFQHDAFSLEIASDMNLLLEKLKAKYVVDAAKLQYLWELRDVLPKRCGFVIAKINISAGQQIKAGFGVVYFKDEIFFPESYHIFSSGIIKELNANVQKFSGQTDDSVCSVCSVMPSHVHAKKVLYLGSRRLQIKTYFKTGGLERLLLHSVYVISIYDNKKPNTRLTDDNPEIESESDMKKECAKIVHATALTYGGGPKAGLRAIISVPPDYSQHRILVQKSIEKVEETAQSPCESYGNLTEEPKTVTKPPFVITQEQHETTLSAGGCYEISTEQPKGSTASLSWSRDDASDEKSSRDLYGILTQNQEAMLTPYRGVFANYSPERVGKLHAAGFPTDSSDETSTRNSHGMSTDRADDNTVCATTKQIASRSHQHTPACDKTDFDKKPYPVDIPSLPLEEGTQLSCDSVTQDKKRDIFKNVLTFGKYFNPAGLHYNMPDFEVFCDFCNNHVKMVIGWAKYDVCLRCAGNNTY